MRRLSTWFGFLTLCICPAVLLAQSSECAAQMQEALGALAVACADVGRNQWCSPEQRAALTTIETLDTTAENYGASLMQIQANLPDTLPDQNVTLLLLGDVWLKKLPGTLVPELQIVTNSAVNIRQSPSSVDWIITEMPADTLLTAVGRNAAGDWLQVKLPDGDNAVPQENRTGWLYAGNVTASGYIESLYVVDTIPSERPMQLFQFESVSKGCSDYVASGLLLQTPPDAGWIDLQINHVPMRLNATLFLQATLPGEMILHVLEGVVKVRPLGVPVDVPAGAELRIPMNELGLPAASPALLDAYAHEIIAFLPVEYLPHLITTPPLLDSPQIDQLRQANSPRAGVWLVKYDIPHVNCFAGQYILQYHTAEIVLNVMDDRLLFYDASLTRIGTGTYTGTRTYQILSQNLPVGISTEVYTFRVYSPTYIEAELSGIWSFTDAGSCLVSNSFKLQFLREE